MFQLQVVINRPPLRRANVALIDVVGSVEKKSEKLILKKNLLNHSGKYSARLHTRSCFYLKSFKHNLCTETETHFSIIGLFSETLFTDVTHCVFSTTWIAAKDTKLDRSLFIIAVRVWMNTFFLHFRENEKTKFEHQILPTKWNDHDLVV